MLSSPRRRSPIGQIEASDWSATVKSSILIGRLVAAQILLDFEGRLGSGWGSVWADKAAGQGLTKLLDKEKMGEDEMKRMR